MTTVKSHAQKTYDFKIHEFMFLRTGQRIQWNFHMCLLFEEISQKLINFLSKISIIILTIIFTTRNEIGEKYFELFNVHVFDVHVLKNCFTTCLQTSDAADPIEFTFTCTRNVKLSINYQVTFTLSINYHRIYDQSWKYIYRNLEMRIIFMAMPTLERVMAIAHAQLR